LIIGATLDAANELARQIATEKGAVFGWHRLTLLGLAAALLSEKKLAPLSRLGTEAIEIADERIRRWKIFQKLAQQADAWTESGKLSLAARQFEDSRMTQGIHAQT
jgi:hypothetical protein